MKFLAIGDVHIKNSTIDIAYALLQEIIKSIKEYKPDYTVILGDLADTHGIMHLQAWNAILDFIKQISDISNLIYVVGNHDMLNNQQFMNNNHWFHVFNIFQQDNIKVVDKPFLFKDILFVPYVYNGRFYEAIKGFNNIKAIFCHQEFLGCKYGFVESVTGDPPPGIPVFSGHIHDRQNMYIGSPIDTSFVAPVDRYIDLITIDDDISSQSILIQNVPRKIVFNTTANNFNNENFVFSDKNLYKIIVSGTQGEILSVKQSNLYQDILKNQNVKIVFKATDIKQIKKVSSSSNSFSNILHEKVQQENKSVQDVFVSNKEKM